MRRLREAPRLVLGRAGMLIIGGALIVACAQAAPGASSTPIVAIDLAPSAAASTSTSTSASLPPGSAPPPSGGDCLARAGQEALVGQPCLQGLEDEATDVTEIKTAQDTIHTVDAQRIEFSLWAVAPGSLKGTAHLSFYFKHERTGNGKFCEEDTDPDPVTWDVQLAGEYSTLPDGRVHVVVAHANPDPGPGYVLRDSCVPGVDEPGIPWPLVSGTLTAGVYDFRRDWPLAPNTTGAKSTIIHIAETDRQ